MPILIVLLIASGLLLVISADILKIQNEIFFVTLLFIPFIFYLILSGKLQELTTPGGLNLRFIASAKSAISDSSIIKIQSIQSLEKDDPIELRMFIKKTDPFKPVILKITLQDPSYHYDIFAL
ncbi:hypothetical protein [Methanoregula sp.]|uniref:hypothetical protein n=1 Tax=Methanoregula sp. TaxID=2052170 RepID=UPI003C754EA7